MDDEFTLRRAADHAAKARVLLDNELYTRTIDKLEQAYVDAWKATSARDTDGRERCWLAYKALIGMKEDLYRAITDGKVAATQLAFMDAEQERAKRP